MAIEMPTMLDKHNAHEAHKSHLKSQIALSKLADSVYKALNEAKVFNLSLEPVTKYSLCRFVDKSRDDFTSDKLRSSTLYFETQSDRYELARFTDNF